MKVSLKKSDIFIPEWNGNQELPEDEQIKISHKFLGSAKRKQYIYSKPLHFTQALAADGEQMGEVELVQDGKGIALETVTKIENLDVLLDDGKTTSVTEIGEFYKYAMHDLAAELEAYLLTCTAVTDSKNSV